MPAGGPGPGLRNTPSGHRLSLGGAPQTPTIGFPTSPSPPPSGSRGADTRVRLSKPEKLAVARLCIQHGEEYTSGSRATFWSKISELGTREIGRPVKNPSQLLRKMLDDYNKAPEHPDCEYERTMAQWKRRVDQVGHTPGWDE
jgi:hypothetical protein